MKVVYFVHGTTTDNETEKCSGWNDAKLTEVGKFRAIELGKIKRNEKIDIIFTSDLTRAIDSAELAFPNIMKIQDIRLRECNYGELNGSLKTNINYEDHVNIPFPKGESLIEVEKRIANFINFLKKNYAGKTIGIVSHRAPQLAFEVLTNGKSWVEAINSDWRKFKDWKPGWIYNI